jgi:TolB-like protein
MLYQFGECSLDTGRLELRRADRRVETEPQVLAVLTYLIENRDRVVPRTELQEKVWGTRVVSDNALNVRIRAARRAIGDDGRTQSMIRTAQRAGYRFAADVQVSGAVTLADSSRQSLPGDEPIRADPPPPAQPSVVVLPLQPIPGGEHEELMASGLTCDITTRIGRSRLLFVIARGTAFQFGKGPHDVREVGKRLGVRYVVQGSVQISDRKMRLIIALADAATRQEIWSEQYNATIDDHMRVQEVSRTSSSARCSRPSMRRRSGVRCKHPRRDSTLGARITADTPSCSGSGRRTARAPNISSGGRSSSSRQHRVPTRVSRSCTTSRRS